MDELQQEEDMLKDVPVSDSDELSPEDNMMVGVNEDNSVESVTEPPMNAPAMDVEEDSFSFGDEPQMTMARPLLSRNKPRLLSSVDIGKTIKNEKALDVASQYDKLALDYVSSEGFDIEKIKRTLTSPNGADINRAMVQQRDLQVKTQSFNDYLVSALARDNEDIARILEEGVNIKSSEIAIEKNAAESILDIAKKDPDFMARIEGSPTLEDDLRNYMVSEIMIGRFVAELQDEADKDIDFTIDLLAGLTGIDSLGKVLKWGPDWADKLAESSFKIRAETDPEKKFKLLQEYRESIKQSMILGGIRRYNPDFVFDTAKLGLTANKSDRDFAETMSFIDVGLDATVVFGLLKAGAKGAKGAYALKKELGAVTGKEVIDEAKKDISNAKDILAFRSPVDMEPSQFNKVQEELLKEREVLLRAEQENVAPVLRTEYQDFPIFTQGTIRGYMYTPDNKTIAEFVKQNGKPFASEEAAKTRAIQLGLDNFEIIEEPTGFVIRSTHEMDAYNAPIAPPKKLSGLYAWNNISDVIDSTLHNKASLAESSINQISYAVGKVWKNSLGKLSTGQRRDMDRVITGLRDKVTMRDGFNRWYTEDEFIAEFRRLTDKKPSEKVIQGYNSYRQISDFTWRMDNKAEYTRILNNNYSGFKFPFSDQSIAAKRMGGLGDDAIVINVDNGIELAYKDIDKTKFDVFEVEPKDRFEMQEAGIIPVSGSRYITVPKSQASEADLDPIRVPYLAGGRVTDEAGTYYVKQLSILDTQSGKVRGRDRTFRRASSKAQAEDFAGKWNRARHIAKQFMDDATVTKVAREEFSKTGLRMSLDDFIQEAKAKGWNLDDDVVAVGNRERIPVPSSGIIDNTADLDLLPEAIGNRFSKRMTERPPHVDPDMDTTFDPMAALANSVNITARNVSYTSFRQFALEDIKNRFGRYMDVPPNAPLRSYLEAPVNDLGVREGLQYTIEAHQKYVTEIVGARTMSESRADQYLDKFSQWALDKDIGPITGTTLSKKAENLKGVKVSDTARKLMFNTTMGFLNPAVTLLQASFAPIVATTVEKYGVRSLANYPLFRTMLLGVDPLDSATSRFFADGASKVSDALDVKFLGSMDEAVREFRNLGLDDFSTSTVHADAGVNTNRISLSQGRGGEMVDKFMSAGRIPFNEGELLPRAVSYMAARAKWLSDTKVNPKGLPATSNAGREFIKAQTKKYVLGIDRADIQIGLRGNYAGVVFQFSSYVWRQTAALLPFNKTFTNKEKFRMMLGYTAFFGTGAVPFGGDVIDPVMEKLFGKDVAYAVHQGLFDGILSLIVGSPTVFRERTQLAKYWGDMYDAFTGEKNFMELAVGPSGQRGHAAFDGIARVLNVFSTIVSPPPDDFTEELAVAAASNISSVNNTFKLLNAWETGVLLTRSGLPLANVSKSQAVAQFFGVPPAEMAVISAGFDFTKENKEMVKEARDNILRLQRLRLESDDPKKEQQYRAAIEVVMSTANSNGFGAQVLSSVHSSMKSDPLYRDLARDMVLRNMKGQEVDSMTLETIKRISEAEGNNR